MATKDKFDNAASFIIEEHIRIYDKMVPHPDKIKDAIARELRQTWNEAVELAVKKARAIAVVANGG